MGWLIMGETLENVLNYSEEADSQLLKLLPRYDIVKAFGEKTVTLEVRPPFDDMPTYYGYVSDMDDKSQWIEMVDEIKAVVLEKL
jgi:hypothetical protein